MRLNNLSSARETARAHVIANTRARGSNERLVGRDGELNATSTKDLIGRMVEIAERISSGDFNQETAEEVKATATERREALEQAFFDPTEQGMKELGVAIAAEIDTAVTRQGFARRLLARGDVAQGSVPRVRVKRRNVEAVVATGPSQVGVQIVKDNFLYPNEFSIVANIKIESRELAQGGADILQVKFVEAEESFMVGEDRVWKRLADTAAPIYNNLSYYSGTLTPATISVLQNEIMAWSLPARALVMAMDLLPDMQVGSNFQNIYEPVAKLEILMTGRLGTLFGMDLITDGYRDPRLRVLNGGELYCTTDPDHLGAYTDRGPIQAEPRNNTGDIPGRGWFMHTLMSMAVANGRGISRGLRI